MSAPATPASQEPLPALGVMAQFSENERRALDSFGERVWAETGEVVIDEAERQNALYFVLDGKLRVLRHRGEAREPLAELLPGEVFGEMALLHPPHSTATVVADSPTILWKLPREQLRGFLSSHPDAGAKLMAIMTSKFGQRLGAPSSR